MHFNAGRLPVWAELPLAASPIIDKAVWSTCTPTNQVTDANTSPIGTGPMLLDTRHNDQEVAYTVNPNWWAIKDLGLSFKFKYLVDIVNGSNNVELGQLLESNIDLSNNFLPGISQLISSPAATGKLKATGGYGLATYYPSAPYMLSANTVWLEPNLTLAPMNNLNFRKALAYAINPQQIANVIYSNLVTRRLRRDCFRTSTRSSTRAWSRSTGSATTRSWPSSS